MKTQYLISYEELEKPYPKMIPLSVGTMESGHTYSMFITLNADIIITVAGKFVKVPITEIVNAIVPDLTGVSGVRKDG